MRPLKAHLLTSLAVLALASAAAVMPSAVRAADKRPNVVVIMMDDVGWSDFGAYRGGKALGHPTPNIDRLASEGAVFTSWYGQSSCTAGRAAFQTGRIPIRTALSVVMAPGDENGLTKATPTIAEFFKKNGYTTYFSGKWHLGDKPSMYPIEHGYDEMREFAAYYPGVYSYDDTSPNMHPWFPKYNGPFWKEYQEVVNLDEWEGTAGKPATKVARITYDYLADFDVRQTDSAVAYIKQHAGDGKPFFMNVNYMKMHNPTNPAPAFRGKSRLGNYSDSMLEADANVGRLMEAIRAEAPDTIVVLSSDNGAWQDAWPDAGATPFRGEKGSAFEGAFRVPGIMWSPGRIPAGQVLDQMMTHLDVWPTTAAMAGLKPPTLGETTDNSGKAIFFDGVDNSAYVTGRAPHSARKAFIYIDGEAFGGIRVDIGDDPENPDLNIAWKYLWTAKDTWLGPEQMLGGIGAVYNLTMDPYEKYDMAFNGAVSYRALSSSPGKYSGQDNGWVLALILPELVKFDASIMKYPSIKRYPGGASTDLRPNLQDPANPVPALDPSKPPRVKGGGG
jgi:arylsulfatase A-like enzyme